MSLALFGFVRSTVIQGERIVAGERRAARGGEIWERKLDRLSTLLLAAVETAPNAISGAPVRA